MTAQFRVKNRQGNALVHSKLDLEAVPEHCAKVGSLGISSHHYCATEKKSEVEVVAAGKGGGGGNPRVTPNQHFAFWTPMLGQNFSSAGHFKSE